MLKFFFWTLLLANGVLFAMQKGYFYNDSREPARLNTQLQADKIKLTQLTPAPVPVVSTALVDSAPQICLEIGNFSPAEAQNFTRLLADNAAKLERREVQEASSYIVYFPVLGGKLAAAKKAEEIRRLGINDLFVMSDAERYSISLGIFKTAEASQRQIASLEKEGLSGAKIGMRGTVTNKIAFQLRDAQVKPAFDKIASNFPNQQVHSCL